MIDPAAQPLPSLPPDFTWVQPWSNGPMTDRLMVELDREQVAMIGEMAIGPGYSVHVGRHRPYGEWTHRRFMNLDRAMAWIARWVELRADQVRAEVDLKIVQRREARRP